MGYGAAIGAIMGGLKSASKGTGKNIVESLVKNPQLQGRLDTSLGDYDQTKSASSTALDQYIRDYLAGSATATTRAGQEQGAIDRYYNGDVDRALAELRTKHAAASNEALDRALKYATHAQNLDRIAGGGGDSSYNRQLALKTGADLNLNTLLQNIAQERADQEYVRQSQLGLAGRRTAIADADLARTLVPAGLQKQELGWNLGTLGNLIGLDQANKFYGVKYKPSGFERGVDIASGVLGGAVGGAMGDLSGGGGGGMMGMFGGGSSAPANPGGVNWMSAGGGWGSPRGYSATTPWAGNPYQTVPGTNGIRFNPATGFYE
jgi:hypothetical protein